MSTSLKRPLTRATALLLAVPVLALALFGSDLGAVLPEWATVRAAGWRVVDPEARANLAGGRSAAGARDRQTNPRPAAVEVADWEYTAGPGGKKVSGSTF